MKEIILNEVTYKLLSNYSDHEIGYDLNIGRWKSVSHYYQAQKFKTNIKSYQIFQEIFKAKTPKEAETIGTQRFPQPKNFIEQILFKNKFVKIDFNWKNIRFEIMQKALIAKVIQHAEVRECLVSTNKSKLIFCSDNQYWGINHKGKGENKLGLLFTKIRNDLLQNGEYDELRKAPIPVWLKYPQYSAYSGAWRQGHSEYYYMQFYYWYNGLSKAGKVKYEEMYPQPEEWDFYECN